LCQRWWTIWQAAPELLSVEAPDEELLIAVPLDCANAVPAASTNPAARVINVRCMKSLPGNDGGA
jgi:hypothetical protein